MSAQDEELLQTQKCLFDALDKQVADKAAHGAAKKRMAATFRSTVRAKRDTLAQALAGRAVEGGDLALRLLDELCAETENIRDDE